MGSNVMSRLWLNSWPISIKSLERELSASRIPLLGHTTRIRPSHIKSSFSSLSQPLSHTALPNHKLNAFGRPFRVYDASSWIPGLPLARSFTSFPRTSSQIIAQVRNHNTSSCKRQISYSRRSKSSHTKDVKSRVIDSKQKDGKSTAASVKDSVKSSPKTFYDRLPHLPTVNVHRPTREELLAAATGFWSRMKMRFKWFSIRSSRPFNADEIGALISWLFLGHIIWILVGTTTFVSLAVLAVNTVFAQETLARWVGNYLTKSTGITVIFESAIVPKWGDGVISFKNVFVSRRPGQSQARVSKGSPESAALAAAANNELLRSVDDQEDTNYTQFDLNIDTVNVTLSFAKWFNSKGLLADVEVKGVRGIVDRKSVHWTGEQLDPKSYRHEHNPGDFELDSFKLEDLLVTVHQPGNFRPFSVSIFSCDLPQLRRQWMFYDFLCANHVSGAFDDSLFTIHPRQMHGHVGSEFYSSADRTAANPWKKHSRMRIDGLNIDHLNRGVEGPFSWITEGNVDVVADVLFPSEDDESIAKVMSDFYDQLESALTSKLRLPDNKEGIINTMLHAEGPVFSQTPNSSETSKSDQAWPADLTFGSSAKSSLDRKFLVMDLRINFNEIRAAVPIFTQDLSYVSSALIRPVVAYLNSRKTFIPITCRIVKRVSDYNGSWTLFDSGMLDDLSAEVYTAIVKDIQDDEARIRRFKKVGLWSLQLAVQALFMGLAGTLA